MWFRLASANWTNTGNLGTMDSISGSWTVTCTTSGGIVKATGDGMVTKGGTWTGTFTLSTGATFTSATLTPASAGTVTHTVSSSTVTVTIANVSANCTLAVVATGGSGGGTTDPTPGGTTIYNDVSYWVRQSISSAGVIETPESAGYTRSNIMAINKFTKAITLKGTSEGMYFAKVTYDASGNFLARGSWDTPAVGVTITYSDANPFNVVIATKAETNYDLAKMISIIDVRDA